MRLGDLDELRKTIKDNLDDLDVGSILAIIDNAPTIIWCSQTSEGLPLMDMRVKPKGEWLEKHYQTGKAKREFSMPFYT